MEASCCKENLTNQSVVVIVVYIMTFILILNFRIWFREVSCRSRKWQEAPGNI